MRKDWELTSEGVIVWKQVPSFPKYQVTACGRVRNIDFYGKTRELKPYLKTTGYLQVVLTNKQGKKYLPLHRVILDSFCWNPNKVNYQVNHIDGDKTNNHISNLEWVTAKENIVHAIETGLKKVKGSQNPNSKLSEEERDYIRSQPKGKNTKFLAKQFKVCESTIRRIK